MEILFYNRNLKCFRRHQQDKAPTLFELGLNNVVLAFDQSTTSTGVTLGNPDGSIIGFLRLIRENSSECGQNFISNFERWLTNFVGGSRIHMLLYEHTHSQGYFRTDVILSQLRGSFTRLKDRLGWEFPMEMVEQQVWKKNIIDLKLGGNHSLTKENAHDILLNKLCPWLPDDEYHFEDIYDSLCIFYYYLSVLRDFKLETPIDVKNTLKVKPCDYKIFYQLGKQVNLQPFERIVNNRGVRYFNYNYTLTPKEHIARLASHSNDLWVGQMTQINNPFIDDLLSKVSGFPEKDDYFFVLGYRATKKKFTKILR